MGTASVVTVNANFMQIKGGPKKKDRPWPAGLWQKGSSTTRQGRPTSCPGTQLSLACLVASPTHSGPQDPPSQRQCGAGWGGPASVTNPPHLPLQEDPGEGGRERP